MKAAKRDLPAAKRLGERLRLLRESQHLSQATLAERAGFTQQQISQVERGCIDTPIETWAKIAEGLGVSMRDCLPEPCTVPLVDEPLQRPLSPEAHMIFLRLGYALGILSEEQVHTGIFQPEMYASLLSYVFPHEWRPSTFSLASVYVH